MKSISTLPILIDQLEHFHDYIIRLIIATSIFQINEKPNMIDIAIDSFKLLDNKENAYYVDSLTDSFYYLASLKNDKVLKLIEEYTNHSECLISYNAKPSLCL